MALQLKLKFHLCITYWY